MPAFSFRHIKDLYPVFWDKAKEVTEEMCQAIRKPDVPGSKPSNVQKVNDWASRVTLDIIGVASMGHDFNTVKDPNNELRKTYSKVFSQTGRSRLKMAIRLILRRSALIRYLLGPGNDTTTEAAKVVRRICHDLVTEKKAKLEKSARTDVDILSVAIESGKALSTTITTDLSKS